MDSIKEYYNHIFYDLADRRTTNWPLMSTPTIPLGIIAGYLMAIYVILPAYMMERKPFNLKKVIAAYNLFQVAACSVLMYGVATSGWTTYYTFGCQLCDFSENKLALRMAYFVWLTLLLKLVELIETVFFVLRKKYNQISVLHVYHHASTFGFVWLGAKFYPGGMLTLCIILNSAVHILMYTYYFLTSLGPDMQKRLEPLKPKLTAIQMSHMLVVFAHLLQILSPSCNVPIVVVYTFLPNVIINFSMFFNFYKSNYTKPKKVKV